MLSKKLKLLLAVLPVAFIAQQSQAQFTLNGQLRDRGEIREGVGNLVPLGSKPAAFISQRTRLNFGYQWDRLTFGVSVQDVRVWGQDASTISNIDVGSRLMLHEGWADILLVNKDDPSIGFKPIDRLSLKVGRQELIYDDARLLGNLDWLQQGRSFDMALLKAEHKGFQVDVGYAFNQNTDAFNVTNTFYVPGNVPAYIKDSKGATVPTPNGIVPLAAAGSINNNSSKNGTPIYITAPNTNGGTQDYKSFTSVHIQKKFDQTKISGLFFNDNFGKYQLDSVATTNSGYVYGRRFNSSGTNSRYTYGLIASQLLGAKASWGNVALQGSVYGQSGSNRDGANLKAHYFSVMGIYTKAKISVGPGYDVLSGNNANTIAAGQDNRFDPLYGTAHKFNGYMDYFYAGTGSPAGGLDDAYFKFKYTNQNFFFAADYHYFALNQPMKQANGAQIGNYLGSEINLTANYNLSKFTNVELGYGLMKASNSMSIAKGQAQNTVYNRTGNWFYLMLNIHPDFFATKTKS